MSYEKPGRPLPGAGKKLLVAGGGYADVPLIEAGKRLGFHVISSGGDPTGAGHAHAHERHLADFSDNEAMLALARSLEIDAICACCNDFAALSAAYVAEQMGLPGHDAFDTAQLVHHKDRYRDFAQANELLSPRAEGFRDLDSAVIALQRFSFPLIIKPVDLTGGKGISRVDDAESARRVLAGAFDISRAKRVVIEEFIEGSRHGITTFVRDGKVVFQFHDNEHYYLNQYLVSAASAPGDVPATAIEQLVATVERFARLLELVDGIVHVQYILREGQPWIIEICRRAPGDLYIELVKFATGVDYAEQIVRAEAGLSLQDLAPAPIDGFWTRHCVMADRVGTVAAIDFDPKIEGHIVHKEMFWRPGQQVSDILVDKFGIVFLRFDSMQQMLERTDQLQELIKVRVQ